MPFPFRKPSGRRLSLWRPIGALATLVMAAAPAVAAPLTYLEGADLSGVAASPTDLGSLGVGLNTITGTINFACGPLNSNCGGDEFDIFHVSLGAGLTITGVEVELSNVDLEFHNRLFSVPSPLGNALGLPNTRFDQGTLQIFSGAVSGSGDLYLGVGIERPPIDPGNDSPAYNTSFNYEYRFQVTGPTTDPNPVPEPATLALAGLALGLAGLTSKRRRRG